jgi:hypothetical protein
MPVAYLVGDARRPRVVEVAPKHAAYWQGLDLPGYEGGPFEDRAGGLIVFGCESLDDARDRGVTSRAIRSSRTIFCRRRGSSNGPSSTYPSMAKDTHHMAYSFLRPLRPEPMVSNRHVAGTGELLLVRKRAPRPVRAGEQRRQGVAPGRQL